MNDSPASLEDAVTRFVLNFDQVQQDGAALVGIFINKHTYIC